MEGQEGMGEGDSGWKFAAQSVWGSSQAMAQGHTGQPCGTRRSALAVERRGRSRAGTRAGPSWWGKDLGGLCVPSLGGTSSRLPGLEWGLFAAPSLICPLYR